MKQIFHILITLMIFSACSDTTLRKLDTTSDYGKSIAAIQQDYPFETWKTYLADGLYQYTIVNCNEAREIMDQLMEEIISLGPDADESTKIKCFETAVLAYNDLEERTNMIETGEREELFFLIDDIGIAAGIDPSKYGSGEGIASEWRDW